MSERRRVCLLLIGWTGMTLALASAGCQLQVSFVDPTAKTPSPKEAMVQADENHPSGLVQASLRSDAVGRELARNGPGVAAPGMPAPIMNGPPHGYGPGTMPGHLSMPMPMGPTPHLPPGVPPGPPHPGGVEEGHPEGPPPPLPTEKAKTSLPPYVIEPPDILLLDPIRMFPKPPYLVSPLDVLLVRVAEPLPNQPIDGNYTVSPDGTINLGYSYGTVRVSGLSLEDVERAIRAQIGRVLKDPQVLVGLAQFRGIQQTRGEHLVRMDGTIHLGSYGCVYVAGLTLNQAKVAVERHLSQYLCEPEVSIDVYAYNSKVYYVITDGAGYGQQVFRFPITGNETVLDAISNIQGLPAVASKKKIWVARPAPAKHPCAQLLPVDWMAITQGGVTTTNYQLFPGDRVYLQSDCLIAADNALAKILAPIERVLGFTFLAASTAQAFRTNGGGGGAGIGFVAPLR